MKNDFYPLQVLQKGMFLVVFLFLSHLSYAFSITPKPKTPIDTLYIDSVLRYHDKTLLSYDEFPVYSSPANEEKLLGDFRNWLVEYFQNRVHFGVTEKNTLSASFVIPNSYHPLGYEATLDMRVMIRFTVDDSKLTIELVDKGNTKKKVPGSKRNEIYPEGVFFIHSYFGKNRDYITSKKMDLEQVKKNIAIYMSSVQTIYSLILKNVKAQLGIK